MSPRDGKIALWLAWVGANAWGELVGLGSVFACGFAFFHHFGEPHSIAGTLVALTLTLPLGAVEGLVVGWAQWRVLRRALPAVARGTWILATIVGAVVAWLLGMLPSTLMSSEPNASGPPVEPPRAVVLLLAVGIGLGGGLVLSLAQWLVLRHATSRAAWWLPANALAWSAAMPWIFHLVDRTVAEHQDPASFALFLAGLGVAGAIVGAIHGLALLRFAAPRAWVP